MIKMKNIEKLIDKKKFQEELKEWRIITSFIFTELMFVTGILLGIFASKVF